MPREKQPPKKVLSIPEVQKYLHLGRAKVINLLETGQIKGQKVGDRWRVHEDAIKDFLNPDQHPKTSPNEVKCFILVPGRTYLYRSHTLSTPLAPEIRGASLNGQL